MVCLNLFVVPHCPSLRSLVLRWEHWFQVRRISVMYPLIVVELYQQNQHKMKEIERKRVIPKSGLQQAWVYESTALMVAYHPACLWHKYATILPLHQMSDFFVLTWWKGSGIEKWDKNYLDWIRACRHEGLMPYPDLHEQSSGHLRAWLRDDLAGLVELGPGLLLICPHGERSVDATFCHLK